MSYQDLVQEYRETDWVLQNLALLRMRQFLEFASTATRAEQRVFFQRLVREERAIIQGLHQKLDRLWYYVEQARRPGWGVARLKE